MVHSFPPHVMSFCIQPYCCHYEYRNHFLFVSLILSMMSKVENTCNICGHVSKYAKDIKKHIKIVHEKNLDYICKYKYCNKKFSNRGNLNTHELTVLTPIPHLAQ